MYWTNTVPYFTGLLVAMVFLAASPQAAQAPEGLGDGAEFSPKPQPVLIDATFQERDPDDGIKGQAGSRKEAPGQDGEIDEAPSRIPAMREASAGEASGTGECPAEKARELHKRVAVTSFSLVDNQEVGLGGFSQIDRQVADKLLNAFGEGDRVLPYSAVDRRIYRETTNAPTQREWDRRLTRASRLSQSMGVQFVVSGVIRDISVEDAGAWGTSLLAQWQRDLGLANRNRRLVVDLYIHDGFSGALLMEQRFRTSGEWAFEPETRVDFGSAEFEASDYGKQSVQLVERMASAVSETLECQPFMASIDRVEERRIQIDSGTESGLEPGDEVALYRSERFLDQSGKPPLLQKTGQTMRVERVQSSFASGTLPVEGHRMNIQRGDRVVIW